MLAHIVNADWLAITIELCFCGKIQGRRNGPKIRWASARVGPIPTARTIDVWQAPIGHRTVAAVCLSGPRTSQRAEQVDLRAHGVSSLVNYLAYAGL